MPIAIDIDKERLREFRREGKVTGFSVVGRVTRDDFRPESDVDVLVTFADDAPWSLLHMVDMKEELETLFGRRVDLLTRFGVETSLNHIRRNSILQSAVALDGA